MAGGPFNFCHQILNPRITANKVSLDGHEVTNLVTVSPASSRGFLVESFIRPPVSITLKFPCNIDIDKVILNGAVGTQVSCSYELYTHHINRQNERNEDKWGSKNTFNLPREEYENYVFTPVGKLYQSTTGHVQGIVCFQNPRFRLKHSHAKLSQMPSRLYGQDCVYSEISPGRHRGSLSDASYLTIRITRASGGGLPAIKWLEIWGQPSLSSSKEDVDNVMLAYHKLSNSHNNAKTNLKHVTSVALPARSDVKEPAKGENVPFEYLDPITCEIMMLPMLLPSGQSIDQGTLEKHNHEEAQWGRKPNNPFTGVPFTAMSKPIPNAGLKLRIDHFLLSEPNSFTLKRTVGTMKDILSSRQSSGDIRSSVLVSDSSREKSNSTATANLKPSISSRSSIPSSAASLDDALDSLLGNLPSYRPDVRTHERHSYFNTNTSNGMKCDVNPRKRSIASLPMQPRKASKLSGTYDDTIGKNVKSSTISPDGPKHESQDRTYIFTNQHSDVGTSRYAAALQCSDLRNASRHCIFCAQDKDLSGMYKLACDETICWKCLTTGCNTTKSIACKKCGVLSSSKDIVKIHR